MHTSYTVGLTEGEFLSLKTVMIDQQEWIQNAISSRAHAATKDIQIKYTNFKIIKGEAITAVGSTAVIKAALDEGVVGYASSTMITTE